MEHKRAIVSLVLVLLVLAGFLLSPATVVDRVRTVLYSPWFPLVLAGLYLVRPLLAWPITALAALVGFRYGVVLGVPVALSGAIVSTFIPYAVMRYVHPDSGLFEWAVEESDQFFSTTGDLRGVVAARLAPVPAEATSLAAGAAEVSPGTYVVGTVVGELPWAVAAVTIGHSMYRLSLSEVSFSPWLVVGTLAAALVLVAGPSYRLYHRVTSSAA